MTVFKSYANREYVLTLTVIETGYSIEKNTSNISWTLTMSCGEWYMQHNNEYFSVTINGSTRLSGTHPAMFPSQHSEITIASGTMSDIPHNADGSLTISCSASYSPNGNTSYKPTGSMTASGSLPLTTIPRATTPTLSYADKDHKLGTSITINLPRASTSFTHEVSYVFGSKTGTISTSATTSTSWILPKELANQIPNALTGNGIIKVVTKSGSKEIGTKEVQFSVMVSDDMLPVFDSILVTRIDNGVPAEFGLYVQGISKAKLTIDGAEGSYGSTIKSYSINGGGYSSDSVSAELGTFENGTITFTAMITDSRSRTHTKTVNITVEPYSPPTLTVKIERCTSNGTADNRGTYVKISPIYSASSVKGKNYIKSKSFSIEGTSYKDTTCASGSSVVLGNGTLAVSKAYTIKASVMDAIGNESSLTITLLTSQVPFNINEEGNAVCIGGYATKEHTFTAYSNGRYIQFEHIDDYFNITTDAEFIRFAKPVMFGSKIMKFANDKEISTDNLAIDE